MTNILSLYKVNYIEESDYILEGSLSLKKSYLYTVKMRPSLMKGMSISQGKYSRKFSESVLLGKLR